MKNRKGNIQLLTAIGWGLVMFAVIIGVGLVVLTKLSDQVASCPATIGGGVAAWNSTLQLCSNLSGATQAGAGGAYTTISYVATQMGSTGLAGWIPVIIVVLIAGLVIALFGGKKNY